MGVETELVDVGGYALAVGSAGTGSPPVVCLSGLTGDTGEWVGVRTALRVSTATVAYGRPAVGGSDPLPPDLAGVARPASWVAGQLRTLLDRAGVPVPRVLVGHSIGAMIAEACVARWPDEVAGLVLVDPTDILLFLDVGKPNPADSDVGGIRFDMPASLTELAAHPPVRVPAVVVTSAVGRWLSLRGSQVERDYRPYTLAELDARWQRTQREQAARTGAVHVLAHTAGHCVHIDAPVLVAQAVDAVVRAARDGGPIRLDAARLNAAGGGLVDHTASG